MKKKILKILILLGLPVLLFVLFTALAPGFGIHSLKIVLSQSFGPAVMGFAYAVLMICGVNDFSVGCRVLTTVCIGGILAQSLGIIGFFLGCILGGVLSSVLLGTLFQLLKIPSLVLSLGYLLVLEGFNYNVVEHCVGTGSVVVFDKALSRLFIFPFNLIWVLSASLLFGVFLYKTKSGYQINAVGCDEMLAQNVGINVRKAKIMAFLAASIFIIVAAFLQVGTSSRVSNLIGMDSMSVVFKPLIGVMIGTQLLRLVRCFPLVILVGEICLTIIFNGLISIGVSDNIQGVVLGLFLLGVMIITENMSAWKEMVRRSRVIKSIP